MRCTNCNIELIPHLLSKLKLINKNSKYINSKILFQFHKIDDLIKNNYTMTVLISFPIFNNWLVLCSAANLVRKKLSFIKKIFLYISLTAVLMTMKVTLMACLI